MKVFIDNIFCNWLMQSPQGALWQHNSDVTKHDVSQITGCSTICSTICLGWHKRKHQSPCHWPFVRGIYRCPGDSPHKGPVTEDVLMSWRHHKLGSLGVKTIQHSSSWSNSSYSSNVGSLGQQEDQIPISFCVFLINQLCHSCSSDPGRVLVYIMVTCL